MTGFVRASRLYDVPRGECVQWDWSKQQPVAESQREVERAVAEIEALPNIEPVVDIEAATDGGDR